MKRGKRYAEAAKTIDRSVLYDAPEAISLVKKAASAKFDETIEAHIRTGCDGRHADQQIRGAVVLPHGTGKQVRVLVFAKNAKAEEAQAAASQCGLDEGNSLVTAIYLIDETQMLLYKQQINDQKLVAGLIYLDNYDEALESVEEVRRSLLTALIDRKISKYISSMNGIVKSIEKDKYFFVIKQQYIARMQEERFSILEDVKTVNIGNDMAVTLSIGIGMNGESYAQNYEYARTSIDMALGRGGDQAVVKDSDKILYYGGKAQQMEKTTRVKARVKAHALKELMDKKDRLLIMGHRMADIDAFGAAVGIYRIAMSMNKKANIVLNDVTSSVRPMMERFQNNPEYPDDMFLKGAKAAELVDAGTMLVVVDVNRPSITDAPELLKLVKTIVVMDHHRQSSEVISNVRSPMRGALAMRV